ncbi:MAG: L,D-transpeptidase family protein [Acidimicrobiales bacterium]
MVALSIGAATLMRELSPQAAGEAVRVKPVAVAGVRARAHLVSQHGVLRPGPAPTHSSGEPKAKPATEPPPTAAEWAAPVVPVPPPTPAPQIRHPWLASPQALPDPATAPVVEVGSSDPAVLVLEQRLTDLGYRPGDIDESFSETTWSAVLAFQKAELLERTGGMDGATWARLAAPQAWRPSPSVTYPRVEVDLERQVVLVLFSPTDVVTLNTSTGGGYLYANSWGGWSYAETPVGNYQVYYTHDGTEYVPLGTLYRPLYFYEGYAIHGSPYVPEYPDSHGCVRLSNDDQDWLFDLVNSTVPDAALAVTVHDTMNPAVLHPMPAAGTWPL